jgi:transcriptional regulator with XRE-family HTH domain
MISKIRLEILKSYGSQERFAAAARLDEALVSKLVRGVRKPTKAQAEKFENLLGVPCDQLFVESQESAAARQ